jgi:predicted nicotinamide N-methyase
MPDDGTWRYEWPAGARFLPEIADLVTVAGKRVIDLGCGRGRLGSWALGAGAAEVVFADHAAEALAAIADGPRVSRLVHAWGEPLPPCEVLLGGDILYLPSTFPSLLDSIASALRPAAVAWLVDPRTRLEPELPALAAQRGLSWSAERRLAGYTLVQVRQVACRSAVV